MYANRRSDYFAIPGNDLQGRHLMLGMRRAGLTMASHFPCTGEGNGEHPHRRVVDELGPIAASLAGAYEPLPHPSLDETITSAGIGMKLDVLEKALAAIELAKLLPPSLRSAVARRQVEWIGGRLCAEHALERLGMFHCGVPRGPQGAPLWPPGIAGSITHTDNAAYALVASRSDGAGLGIDSEPLVDESAQSAVASLCCCPSERAAWLGGTDCRLRTTLLFAAKEAFYKAAWPAVGRFIDFDEVTVQQWNHADGTIVLRLGPSLTEASASACYHVDEIGGIVHTRVSLDVALVARLASSSHERDSRSLCIDR